MSKNNLLHQIVECITNVSPKNIDDFLVVYPAETKDVVGDIFELGISYINAANLLVDTIYSHKVESPDDQYALPILNQYSHGMELLLKALIKKLVEHRLAKCCNQIFSPPTDYQKRIKNHDVVGLLSIVEKMLPSLGLHEFPNWDDISSFIEDLFAYGVNSESTRYPKDVSGTKLPLHCYQSWVNLAKIKENVKVITVSIENYIWGEDFVFCQKDFLSKKLTELKNVKSVTLTCSDIIKKYSQKVRENEPVANNQFGVINISELKDVFFRSDYDKVIFLEELSILSNNQIAAIAMALDFTNPAICIGNLESYEEMDRNENIEIIISKAHLYDMAINNLDDHIANVQKRVAEKNNLNVV